MSARSIKGPQGNIPQFANTGVTEYQYWVIARNASQKASNPLYIGRAKTNGSGNIAVTFYSPLSMSDFTVVRATGDVNTSVPTGTGNYAVAIDTQASSACDSKHVCKVADTQEKLKSYTMPTASGKPGWYPILPMGVGGLILGGTGSTTSAINAAEATLNINQYNRIGLFQNNVAGLDHPVVFSQQCLASSPGAPLGQVCGSSDAGVRGNATILSGAYTAGVKGRFNFLTSNGKSHIITLVDSAPDRTLSAMGSNNRPSYDHNDAYIGCDSNCCQEAHTGIAFGAPVSISSYLANAGDGTAWKERLTATTKALQCRSRLPAQR